MPYNGIYWYTLVYTSREGTAVMHLDKQHPVPIYLQLKELLRNQIEQGVYRSHQKLPSERDLCQLHDLSRMTARRALQELIDEGLVYTRVGKGTFVSDKLNNDGLNKASVGSRREPNGADLANRITLNYQHKLVDELSTFNCVGAEKVINDALAAFPLELVATKLFPAVIRQLEQEWQQGKVSLLAQNYAITTLRSHLTAMFNAATTPESRAKLLLACAPQDQHEIGLLLFALSLRRRGFRVIYLGPNVTSSDFRQVIDTAHPDLICFSAATVESARALVDLSQQILTYIQTNKNARELNVPLTPLFAFAGGVFVKKPWLIARLKGLYLGDTVETAVQKVQKLVVP
jgi:DNA-binding transcriptional regulator YhcF (GntR family)/methanogenic corrinoid protein MtbC1